MWYELLINVHYCSTMAAHSSHQTRTRLGGLKDNLQREIEREKEGREKETCNLPKQLERVEAGFCFTLV